MSRKTALALVLTIISLVAVSAGTALAGTAIEYALTFGW
jgi:hypothetical protein